MKYKEIRFLYLLIILLILGCGNSEKKDTKGKTIVSDYYELVKDWPKLPDGLVLGNPTGLGIDSEHNILVFHRASRVWQEPMPEDKIQENTILTLDKQTGEVLKSWGADLFIMPHGLEIDKENNIWVTDVALHQIFKFNSDGDLLLTLGEGEVPGNDNTHFNLPTDVAVAEDGSFYVSDGYGNSRVIKFTKDGKYLFEWGKFGNKQGEFNIPHGIDLDKEGNVYKPVLLPQRDPSFYSTSIYNFNRPVFIKEKVRLSTNKLTKAAYSNIVEVNFDPEVDIDALSGATRINMENR